MKKVIGYLRVSTPDQNEARQRKLIKDYCILNNYEYLDDKEINDEKKSGTITEREGLVKLLQLSSKDADIVMMSETSRLSRQDDLMNLLNSVNTILQGGLDVFFLDSNYTYKGGAYLEPVDLMRLVFEASANAKERKNISLRMVSGKRSKVKQGCFLGNQAPFGYKTIPNPDRIKGKEFGSTLLIIDEANRQIVEKIFDLIGNKGYTIRGTARYLNQSDILKDGKNWQFSTIWNIISNKLYTGEYSHSGESCFIPSIAIVSKEMFELVRVQIKSNHLQLNKGNVNYNPLKSLVKCPCGGNMSMQTSEPTNIYYNCVRKKSDYIECNCKNYGINADFLNSIVWKVTQAFINQRDFELKIQEATKSIKSDIEFKEKQLIKQISLLETLSKNIETATNNLLDEPDKAIFQLLSSKLSLRVKEQTDLNKTIERINKELSKLRTQLKNYTLNIDSALLKSLTEQQKNEIYKKYIEKITYYSETKFKGFIHIIYKTGYDAVIMTESFRNKIAYELPQCDSFNPITRKVIERFETANEPDKAKDYSFIIKADTIRESNYKEMFERNNMEEFNMSKEISKEEIEMRNEADEKYSNQLKELNEAIEAEKI